MANTASTGTTITLEKHDVQTLVILTNLAAPADLRRTEAGRIIHGGFQPAPFAAWALSPETLRIIADIIEGAER